MKDYWVATDSGTDDHLDAAVSVHRHTFGGENTITVRVNGSTQGFGPNTALSLAAYLIFRALKIKGKKITNVTIKIK